MGTDADMQANGFLQILLVEEDDVRAFVAQCELNRLERPCSVQRLLSLDDLGETLGRFKPSFMILGERVSRPECVRQIRSAGVALPLICILPEGDGEGAVALMDAGANDCILSSQFPFINDCVRSNLEPQNSRALFCRDFQGQERTIKVDEGVKSGWTQFEEGLGRFRAKLNDGENWTQLAGKARHRWNEFSSLCRAACRKLKVRYLVRLADLIARQKSRPAFKKRVVEQAEGDATSRLKPVEIVRPLLSSQAPLETFEAATQSGGAGEGLEAFHSLELAFKALFHTAFDPIILVDNASAILHANAAAAALFGCKTADLLGRKLLSFAASGCGEAAESEWEMLLTLASHQGELRLKSAEGDEGEERVTRFRGRTNLWFGVHLIVLREAVATEEQSQKEAFERSDRSRPVEP